MLFALTLWREVKKKVSSSAGIKPAFLKNIFCIIIHPGKENEKLADKLTAAAYAAVNRIKPAKKGQRTLFKDLPEEEEDQDYSVYAYFVFRDKQ